MNVSTEKKDNHEVVLTIEVEADRLGKAVKQAIKLIANSVNIPGFRKGKAPKQIVEQFIGKQAVLDEAFHIVERKATLEAFDQEKIVPVTNWEPEKVTLEEGKNLVYKVAVTAEPEVTLGDYKGLSVEKEKAEAKEEDVDKQIESMRARQAKMVDAEDGAEVKDGDFVTLDFDGYVDGRQFEGGEGKDYPLQIGSGHFIPGFEEQLIGAKAGEDREVNVKFPEDYAKEDLAGKDATFKCKIHTIRTRILPELNDEFVQKASTFQTVEELKNDIREKLQKSEEQRVESEYREKAIQMATDNATVDIPQVMIDDRVTAMIRQLAVTMEARGMSMEQYLQYSGTDIAKIREEYRESAEKMVKRDLVLEAIAKAEEIKVDSKEIDAEVKVMAAAYGAKVSEVRKVIREQGSIGNLIAGIEHRKASQFIMDNLA